MLKGKNAVITGARRGIGRACVELFAQNGANIWACARKKDEAFEADMAALAKANGVWIKPVYFDLALEDEIKSGVKELLKEKLPVDILINNAGMAHGALLQMTSMKDISAVFQANYFAPLLITQLISRVMMRQKSGTVLNLSSVEGIIGNPGYCAYGGSKAALAFATKTMAKELAPYNIRVNAVAPGLVETDMGAQMDKSAQERMLQECALHRMAKPDEIANTVLFLASDKASFITGQVLRVDGGM